MPESTRQARRTVCILAAALLLFAGWSAYGRHPVRAAGEGSAALVLLLLAAFLPRWAVLLHNGWMWLAACLGWVNSRILMALVFYGLFTPVGLIARLAGRDPLHRRRKGAASYWRPRTQTRQSHEQFERLF